MNRTSTGKFISVMPNCITSLRIVGTACLLFIEPLSTAFYIIYTLSGLSDLLDGWIARATRTTSELGSRLDSIADLLFYAVMLIRILPVLWKRLPLWIWYIVGAALALRVCSYSVAAAKYKRFSAMHTYGNKITGGAVFVVPHILLLNNPVPLCTAVCVIAVAASLEELILHICSKTYQPQVKSVFIRPKKSA